MIIEVSAEFTLRSPYSSVLNSLTQDLKDVGYPGEMFHEPDCEHQAFLSYHLTENDDIQYAETRMRAVLSHYKSRGLISGFLVAINCVDLADQATH